MRDKRFVTIHRGGLLTKENHHFLIRWARACSEHVLPLTDKIIDMRLAHALEIAREWENDKVPTGDAMKASAAAHAVAREFSDPVSIAVARSIGQAVATAHKADHSVGAALYALKAVKHAGKSVVEEKKWQIKQLQLLPTEIAKLVLTTLMMKEKSFIY